MPVAALPPDTPFTCQVTEVFDEPLTVELKVCVAPARTLALGGATVTVTLDPEGGALELAGDELFVAPVHAASVAAAARNRKSSKCRKTNFFILFIRMQPESTAQKSRIACIALCLCVGTATTVRKDKIGHGTPEQAGDVSNNLGSASGLRGSLSRAASSVSTA